jgi:hypothetical protein
MANKLQMSAGTSPDDTINTRLLGLFLGTSNHQYLATTGPPNR